MLVNAFCFVVVVVVGFVVVVVVVVLVAFFSLLLSERFILYIFIYVPINTERFPFHYR